MVFGARVRNSNFARAAIEPTIEIKQWFTLKAFLAYPIAR